MHKNAQFIRAHTMLPPDAHIIVEDIAVGDHVKVCVEIYNHTEKFWAYVRHIDGNEITCQVDQDMRLSRYHGLFDKSMFIIDRYLILGVISNANEQHI